MKRSVIFSMLVLALVVLPAHAGQSSARFTKPYIGGNIGIAEVQESSAYSNSESANGYGGFYLVHNLSLELWIAYLGQFDVKNTSNTYSESSGAGLAAAYRIDTSRLFALRPSVGVFYSRTEITFNGQNIGEDSGSDLMFGLSGVFTINEHVLVNINTHLFKNVSGSDIGMFSVGAGYQF
ncbi:MAG: porin family protein [Gammaproteobacteria bacterium]|nr:porin family protein [Gammaproteobacteria bacterium]